MKKIITFCLVFLFIIAFSYSSSIKKEDYLDYSFAISISSGMRMVNCELYEDVYGKQNPLYGIEFGFKPSTSMEIFFHTEIFEAKGELTYTKEESTLEIAPLEIGIKLLPSNNSFMPFIGGGVGYYTYSEENVMGKIEESEMGYFGIAGIRINFGKLFIEGFGKYIYLKVTPSSDIDTTNAIVKSEEIDLGGISYGVGIGYKF